MSEKYILRSREAAYRVLGEETVVISCKDSTLFTLSEVATKIWEAADGLAPLSEIVEQHICPEFEVSSDVAYADAVAFVEELAQHNILQVSDRPISER